MKFILWIATLCLICGCEPQSTQSRPRPTDSTFIDWLNYERVTTKKGVFFDEVWTIAKGEVSDFNVIRSDTNPKDKIYSAVVSFRATAKGSGIQVNEGIIRYKDGPTPRTVQFVDFVPVSATRIGN